MKKAIKQSTLIYILNGISIFLLVFMAFSFWCYSNVNKKIDAANSDRFELTYNANRFMNGSAYLTNEVRAYAATGKKQHYDNYWNEINNLKNREAGVERMKEIGITASEQAMIDEMSNLSNTLVPLEDNAMKDVELHKEEQAIDYVYGDEYSSSIAKINQLKSDFLETLDARASGNVKRLIAVSNVIKAIFVLCLLLVIAMQILTVRIIKLKVLKPIIEIRDEMGEISKGNLSHNFTLEQDSSEIGMLAGSIHQTKRELKKYVSDISDKLSKMAEGNMDLTVDRRYLGEFAPIQDAMNKILDSLNLTLSQINVASEQVTDSSVDVASGAQNLAQGATEQSRSVEELSEAVKEISSQLGKTTQDAASARTYSIDTSEHISRGNQKMQELSEAMSDISGSSNQIGGIIKTIEDISFQTNILALNAAVEAARAGTAGKGFAVVADEVRNLAAKSSEAAKSTTTLIENTLQLVERGVALTSDTTSALSLVVEGAKKSTELVEEIADSSARQIESIHHLEEGIEQISHVVTLNADTADQSAASSAELSDQAERLKSSVQQFRLRR